MGFDELYLFISNSELSAAHKNFVQEVQGLGSEGEVVQVAAGRCS